MDPSSSSRATEFLACTFTMLLTTWAVYGLRVYVRAFVLQKIFPEDYIITVGMVTLTTFAATVPVQVSHGGGQHVDNIRDAVNNIPVWGQAFFLAEVMYLLTLCAAKLSITVLLLRFATTNAMARALKSIALLTTAMTLAFILWMTFQCEPVKYQWDTRAPGVCASRQAYVVSVYILSAISAATDICTVVIPVCILYELNIDRRNRIAAGLTLAIGSGGCIVTLVRFKYIQEFAVTTDVTYAVVPLCICSFIEVSIACICASLITLRPLLPRSWQGIQRMSSDASGEQIMLPPYSKPGL